MARSGRLQDSIVVKERPNVTDDFGEQAEVYNKVFSAKCDFRALTGEAQTKASLELNREVATILMRIDNRLQYKHYIEYEGMLFEVDSISKRRKQRDMIVTVSRQVV